MTIGSTDRLAGPFNANGSVVAFDFDFKVFEESDIRVVLTNSAGVESDLVLTTHYTVALNDDGEGGTVTTVATYAAGNKITIVGDIEYSQPTEIKNLGGFYPSVIERAFDRACILIQQLLERVDRALQFPVSDGSIGVELPTATARASKTLAFDGSGNPIATSGSLTGVPVSSAMEPVVQAATLTVARTALGLGSGAAGYDGRVLASSGSDLIWTDYSRAPLNINPNWHLDQINSGGLYTASSAGLSNGPDGWSCGSIPAASGVFKIRTLADPDNAALKCLEITCTTADVSIAAGDVYNIVTAIEGYDLAALKPGTAGAGSITVMFRFKTNVTGVYGVAIRNSATNRSYVGTITVADTAEHDYAVTLTLDTAGAWLYTTGVGAYFSLCLAAGSTYQAAAGSWQAGNFLTTAAQCNFMSANTNIAYLKRFHIIPGNAVLTYQPADMAAELEKAERYYQALQLNSYTYTGQALDADNAYCPIRYRKQMRGAPTITLPPAGSAAGQMHFTNSGGNTPAVIGSHAANSISNMSFWIAATGYTGMFTSGHVAMLVGSTAAIQANARLS